MRFKEDFNKKKGLSVVLVFLFSLMLSVIFVGEGLAEAKDEVKAPEKKILELELEGISYEIEHSRYISDMGYIIYIDQERYELIEHNSTERIQSKDRPEHLPEVYMEIWREETEPKVFSNKLENKLKDTHGDTVKVEVVNSPVDGIRLSGGSFDTFWEYYYLVDGPQNDSFVIKQRIPGGESGYFEGMCPVGI
ncbi:hypothetical protein [Natranaerofaba carboxydovora]|uniref:hypothetical protein n=1 Tax=Natranaerofaba carboxydovora TaxID=2742683 RepID=UPI001F14771D|nr:hypothetical protein [Natranaerofaba carboxydovora]UMZ74426.1 hypothetical protein ACONDI_02017 [Natranaerofaba carboxydovora]